MSFTKNNKKVIDLYKGNKRVIQVYKNNTIVYEYKLPAGQVIFESSIAGTYTVNIPTSQNYNIRLVGGGGGGAMFTNYSEYRKNWNGGSAGMVYGTAFIHRGTYTVIVGNAGTVSGSGNSQQGNPGGDTTFNNIVAGGGGGAQAGGYADPGHAGSGGVCSTVIESLTKSNGTTGSTADRYGSYGGGGASSGFTANPGKVGYIIIETA